MAHVTARAAYKALILGIIIVFYTDTTVSDELTTTSNNPESSQAQDLVAQEAPKITGVVGSTAQTNPQNSATTTTSSSADKPKKELSPLEQDIVALFKEFNDPKSTISWADFCHKMADILAKDTKYNFASNTFKDLSQSTWSIKIIWKLSSLKKYLPSYVSDLFKGYSLNNFRTMLNKRLSLGSSLSSGTKA